MGNSIIKKPNLGNRPKKVMNRCFSRSKNNFPRLANREHCFIMTCLCVVYLYTCAQSLKPRGKLPFFGKDRQLKAIIKDSVGSRDVNKGVKAECLIILPVGPGSSSLLPTWTYSSAPTIATT